MYCVTHGPRLVSSLVRALELSRQLSNGEAAARRDTTRERERKVTV